MSDRDPVGSPIAGISLRVGDVLAGKYRLDGLVGEGGTGIVVSATHLSLERRVAIKFLRTALASEEIRLRFDREARAIESIESDHVVAVLDFGFLPDGLPYMVIEFLEGRDLARVLREDGPMSVEDAVGCMLQVCEALSAAHAIGIVHRDLKPANLFLTRDGDGVPHVKVVDFGISKIGGPVLLAPEREAPRPFHDVTAAHAVLGSPRYMAPEQIRSSKNVDARADLWSVGAVLFQLVTGKHAFEAETNVAATVKVLASEPEALTALAPHAPPELEAVVRRCLAKDASARWQTAHELAEALRPFASEQVLSSIERRRDALADPTVDLVDLDLAPRSSAPRAMAPVPLAPTTVRLPPPAPAPRVPLAPGLPAFVATPAPVAHPVPAPPAAPPRRLFAFALAATLLASLAALVGWRARRRRSAAPRRETALDAPARRP